MGIIDEPADLDRLGGAVDRRGGVTFVPGLAGLAAPVLEAAGERLRSPGCRWAPSAATWCVPPSTASPRRWRCSPRRPATTSADRSRACGSTVASPAAGTLLQVQADLLQAPVEVYPSPHATALGVAAFARPRRPGDTAHVSAVPPWQPAAVVEPAISADEAAERLARWRLWPKRRWTYERPTRAGRSLRRRGRRRRRRRRAPSPGCSPITTLRVALVEAGPDVGAGTSKANTAILHTGFDATPGTIEARLVARGYELLRDYAPTVGDLGRGDRRGARGVGRRTGGEPAEPRRARPRRTATTTPRSLTPQRSTSSSRTSARGAGGMLVPDEHIIDPWSTPARVRHRGGRSTVRAAPATPVVGGSRRATRATSSSTARRRRCAADSSSTPPGSTATTLHRLLGLDGFTVTAAPRRADRVRQAGPPAAAAARCCRCPTATPRACSSRRPCSAT